MMTIGTLTLVGLVLAAGWGYRRRRAARRALPENVIALPREAHDLCLWSGTVREVVADGMRYLSPFQVKVYTSRLFIGYAGGPYPVFSVSAETIKRVHVSPGRVNVHCSSGKYLTLYGEPAAMAQLARRLLFVAKRARRKKA